MYVFRGERTVGDVRRLLLRLLDDSKRVPSEWRFSFFPSCCATIIRRRRRRRRRRPLLENSTSITFGLPSHHSP